MNELANWPLRRWITAVGASLLVAGAIGLPTDVIPNPVFGRPVDVTWWSYPILVVTAVMAGLLIATYVRSDSTPPGEFDQPVDAPSKAGGLGGMLSFFAVGCPTCNKLAVIALGSTGALDWFAPAQPALAVLSVLLLGWALRARLSATACRIAT